MPDGTFSTQSTKGETMNQVKVTVFRPKRGPFFKVKWVDPESGRQKQKSTKTIIRRDADRFASRLEKELQDGTYFEPTRTKWKDFRLRYETEAVPGLAVKSGNMIGTAFNAIERIINPNLLAEINTSNLSRLVASLRASNLSETTIRTYLVTIRSALVWGFERRLIPVVPTMPKIKRVKKSKMMKGRPITTEEFERMLDRVERVVGEDRAPSWRFFLQGLWLSGLRLDEALELWWDRDDRLSLDLRGRFPMLKITAESEKGNQDRLLPITPDFAEFLDAIPEDERAGRVFQPKAARVYGDRLRMDTVSTIISDIGKAAGVVVHTCPRTGKVKFASAQDLRRSYGERWASKVMPQVLMQLMRHESIETTNRFYVGRNAESAAAAVWGAVAQSGGAFGGATENTSFQEAQKRTQATMK
jgi:integrase